MSGLLVAGYTNHQTFLTRKVCKIFRRERCDLKVLRDQPPGKALRADRREPAIIWHRELFITVTPLYLRSLQSRLPGLFCRLFEPVFETHLAQSRGIVGKQCPLAHLDAVVTRV